MMAGVTWILTVLCEFYFIYVCFYFDFCAGLSLSEWLRNSRLVMEFLGVSVTLRVRMQTFQGLRDPSLLQVFVVFLLVSLSHDDRVFALNDQ